LKKIRLRALEIEDIDFLYSLENDRENWNYSNRVEYYSRALLEDFIEKQRLDIYQTRQKRFVITSQEVRNYGFVDLYDFEPKHKRAGVGITILKEFRSKGIGSASLLLLEKYAIQILDLHQIYANVAMENLPSIRLFERAKYKKIAIKKDWNYYGGKFHDEILYQKIL